MVLVVRALKIYFNDIRYSSMRLEQLKTDYSASRQATIEHFFALFSDWPWQSQSFDERAVFLEHPNAFIRQSDHDVNMREMISSSLSQAMTSSMAILSPQAPFRCTVP